MLCQVLIFLSFGDDRDLSLKDFTVMVLVGGGVPLGAHDLAKRSPKSHLSILKLC